MMDNYGRLINNMRISVTQECNLDCFYCHKEGENGGLKRNGNSLMTPLEIEKITEIASQVGIKKLKVTGGEPLIRKDIVEIVKRVSKHMNEVSMTTNGVLLGNYAKQLRDAGLKRVNISLDAFDPIKFRMITKKDHYRHVKEGVETAIKSGLSPVKLNMVILRGINENDILQAIDFSSKVGAVLQLIEFESAKEEADSNLFQKYYYDLMPLEKEFATQASDIKERNMHRRKKYFIPSEENGYAEVEVVRAMHNSQFCGACTRLRVTSKGELKPCLFANGNHINIIDPIRNGTCDNELIGLFESAILKKEPYWGDYP
jgi:cyclic pyranopterin phosphate synthase